MKPYTARLAALTLFLAAGAAASLAQAPAEGQPATDALGRRIVNGEPRPLAFRNVRVEQIIPFIAEATGKVVIPQPDVLTRSITVLNDTPIPREQALDLVFLALQQNGIAVVETENIITLRDITEIDRQDVPVIGPGTSVLRRPDLGTIAQKVFALEYSSAETLGNVLKDDVPKYAKMTIDVQSNQIVIMGNIALLKRMETLITSLDRPKPGSVITETFRLRYADAEQIKTNIEELYSADARRTGAQGQQRGGQQGGGGGGQNQRLQQLFGGGGQQGGQQGGTAPGTAQPTESLRVTANTQQNSVTVGAEPSVIADIRRQIEDFWDVPLPEELLIPKTYDLVNSDPIKVRDALEGLFGRGTATTGGGGGGQAAGRTGSSQANRLAGQFSFQAIPEAGRIIVVARSPDHLSVIDKIIEDLDRPQSIGLPTIIELKHASSEDLSEQLNTLLAQDGTLAQIRRSESGLSTSAAGVSPFAQDQQAGDQQQATPANMIAFWWQRSRPPTDSSGASNLVGRIRIVPVWRQNAVMVLSPPEYRNALVELINALDKPGRQVLLKAVVVEVSRDDATALGLRWSSQPINTSNPDNALSIGANANATESNIFGQMFDTSILNVETGVNVVLQALAQNAAINVLSEPRIFTGDNQEAEFFDGQDIPFVTDSQSTDTGNIINSFDYRAVGIQLRARPRITVNGDVDLRVNLQLAAIVPGQTLFGGFIVNRRETTTQVIVQNGRTVVISGILRREQSQIVRKVPILGDIPILNILFRSTETADEETELIVFITPVIVNNVEDADAVNESDLQRLDIQRDKLLPDSAPKQQEPPPVQGD